MLWLRHVLIRFLLKCPDDILNLLTPRLYPHCTNTVVITGAQWSCASEYELHWTGNNTISVVDAIPWLMIRTDLHLIAFCWECWRKNVKIPRFIAAALRENSHSVSEDSSALQERAPSSENKLNCSQRKTGWFSILIHDMVKSMRTPYHHLQMCLKDISFQIYSSVLW